MSIGDRFLARGRTSLMGLVVAVGAIECSPDAWAAPCLLARDHAGITFPVEQISPEWTCRLQFLIDHHLTATTVGPLKTAMDESMYMYLLDRPPFAAALMNRLDLAEYKAEARGAGQWWGNDGEGTEGLVQLVYHDRTTRVYYLEGTHRNRPLPPMTGKAVVFLRMRPVKDASGADTMESRLVSYTMLDSRILSGMGSLLRPLIGGTVSRKLAKGVEVVNRLGLEMRQRPERVLFEATDPPRLLEPDIAFLEAALVGRSHRPTDAHSSTRRTP
jgi:hypothetical protein